MVDADWMRQAVRSVVPDAQVHPSDLTGGGDHWHVVVVSPTFEGQRPLQRQRPILAALTPHVQGGLVHALDLKCITPAELRGRHGGRLPTPFVPHRGGEGMHPAAWD